MEKYKATGIYARYGEIFFVNNKSYALRWFRDNSAPCANCAFFNHSNLSCDYPNKDERLCRRESGTTKGWDTLEYLMIPERYIVLDEQLYLF